MNSATTIMTAARLYRPLLRNDTLELQAIVATAQERNFKIGKWTVGILVVVALFYTLFVFLTNRIFADKYFTALNHDSAAEYLTIMTVFLLIGSRNLVGVFFGSSLVSIMYAWRKRYLVTITEMIATLCIYGLTLYLLALKIYPVLPFLFWFLGSIIITFLLGFYLKASFSWLRLKPKRAVINQIGHNVVYFKIYQIGLFLLRNCDIIIIYLVLGLDVGAIFSIYMLIALSLRHLMISITQAWRDYYSSLVAMEGRLFWADYKKLERISFLLAAIAFCLQYLATPYLINALYNQPQLLNPQALGPHAEVAYRALFLQTNLGLIFALITALIIICEPVNILLYAKQCYQPLCYKILGFGIVNVIFGTFFAIIFSKVGHGWYLWSFKSVLIIQICCNIVVYGYLWWYNWLYLTYNSQAGSTLKHMAYFTLVVLITVLGFVVLINEHSRYQIAYGPRKHLMPRVATWTFAQLGLVLAVISAYTLVSVSGTYWLFFGQWRRYWSWGQSTCHALATLRSRLYQKLAPSHSMNNSD